MRDICICLCSPAHMHMSMQYICLCSPARYDSARARCCLHCSRWPCITAPFCMPMSYQRLKSCTVTPACICMHNPESTQCKKSVESLRVGLGVRHCHPPHHRAAPGGGLPATAGRSLARGFWACRAHGPPGRSVRGGQPGLPSPVLAGCVACGAAGGPDRPAQHQDSGRGWSCSGSCVAARPDVPRAVWLARPDSSAVSSADCCAGSGRLAGLQSLGRRGPPAPTQQMTTPAEGRGGRFA